MQRQGQPIDRKRMREMNQAMLLNLIRTYAPISRGRLKELSGLSWGTIVGITAILIEQELVKELEAAETTGGRKAGLLEIFPEGSYTIGLSLKEQTIVGVIVDLRGNIVRSEEWSAPLRDNGAQAVELIADGVEGLIERCEVPRHKILGLGCGIPGPVNPQAGIVVDSWLGWHNVEITSALQARLNIPVIIGNAVSCLASYEWLYGHGQSFKDFLLVTLGRGLGLSCVLNNQPFRGGRGIGAEFGHIPVFHEPEARLCECGNYGCLEEYVSTRGILKTYRELVALEAGSNDAEQEITIEEITFLASQGDAIACQTFHKTGTMLGIGLAMLINLFNPGGIIIYDGDAKVQLRYIYESMKATMNKHIFSQLGKDLTFIIETDVEMANWARGAACLVLQDFFAVPRGTA